MQSILVFAWAPRLATVVSFGLCSLSLIGCGGSSKTSTTDKPSAATAASDVKSLLEKATAALQQRQWKSALETLTEAIKLDPKCSEAYFQRASLLADAGQAQVALIDFTKAIELSPKDAKLRHTRGFFLMTQKQIDHAIADFTAAIEINPKHTQALNNRGLAWLSKTISRKPRGLQSGLADRTKICRVADQSRLRGVSVETTQTGNRRL